MTLDEAVQKGHKRVRKPCWAFAEDYLLLDIFVEEQGMVLCGPWARLYSPLQLVMSELERPQMLLMVPDRATDWEPYTGPPVPDEVKARDERGRNPFED